MKPYRFACAALALSLAASTTTPAAARKAAPSARGIAAMLKKAVTYCEAVVARKAGTGLPVPMGANIHDGTPPAVGTPDLVKRFAAMQSSRHLASSSPFYVQFLPAAGAQVWAVVYDRLPTCDVMVTGSDGDMPAAAAALSQSLRDDDGWQVVASVPATDAMPLAQHLLVKKTSPAGGSDFDVQLKMRALAATAADRDGIQMELGFIGGTGTLTAGQR